MRVMMSPHPSHYKREESGIWRVVLAYAKYLPQFGAEIVAPTASDFDVLASHAGSTGSNVTVSHCHGLYFTADYTAPAWEYGVNQRVVDAVRTARQVTVPSRWVAEIFERDMRFTPHVIPHGIDWQDWEAPGVGSFLLWNKNRTSDVCDAQYVLHLAQKHQDKSVATTFLPANARAPKNMTVTGLVPHKKMKHLVQDCRVYLATTKETFGIGTLEAMAAGKPVLGFAHGGINDLVEHGINGYLVQPGNLEDLSAGLEYCWTHAGTLGANGREMAKQWTWEHAVEQVAGVYRLSLEREPAEVSIVIPCYNKANTIERAVDSALEQTAHLARVIVVDDGSTDASTEVLKRYAKDKRVLIVHQANAGVANARNRGISEATTKYVCCLDGDDWLDPTYLAACVHPLESDNSFGIAYTGLTFHKPDGETGLSKWPGDPDFNRQLKRHNQVPTCCVFRREMWQRLGGYKQRYAPGGAGSEDAEFWLRAGENGWGMLKATEAGLFHYSWMSGQVSGNKDYKEVDWLGWHPWAGEISAQPAAGHLFASLAKPRRMSHPVRQYDQPVVSVVLPVGPGHEQQIINALDSLEAQTFRRWEAIVVWDTGEPIPEQLRRSYPYVRWFETEGKRGAGVARNLGAASARAPMLLFLDADDWLYPAAIEKMLNVWNIEHRIVYTDYVGRTPISDVTELAEDLQKHIYQYDGTTAIIGYRAAEFDCEKVMRQPEQTPYVFCNVTALVPKTWHDAVNGFDEAMPSWEDVDYHWRLARAGYCYVRLAEELMVYQFNTGTRRDSGLQMHKNLVQYIGDKYNEGGDVVGCPGCGAKRPVARATSPIPFATLRGKTTDNSVRALAMGGTVALRDEDMVKARYVVPKRGDHPVVGPVTKILYGEHSQGDIFLVHRADIERSSAFEEIRDVITAPAPVLEELDAPTLIPQEYTESAPTKEPDAPKLIGDPLDLTKQNVRQIRETLKSPALTKPLLRAMLEVEQAGSNRATVVNMLEGKIG